MYLKDVVVENVGPIDNIELSMPFNEDGTPQPLVVVGRNGSGKSILLSLFADALILFGQQKFNDVAEPDISGGTKYFRLSGTTNQGSLKPYSLSLLAFSNYNDGATDRFYFYDKTGTLDQSYATEKYGDRFGNFYSWTPEGNAKQTTNSPEELGKIFSNNVLAYFSAGRFERPHWFNSPGGQTEYTIREKSSFTNILGKPIYIESSLEANKSWVLSVLLDSMVELIETSNPDGTSRFDFTLEDRSRLVLRLMRRNIEAVLKKVFKNEDVVLFLRNRSYSTSRVGLVENSTGKAILPSLDHMSTGQTVLFNIFVTILRYADVSDIVRALNLSEITGVVIIDEIDSHLHADLIYEQLPELINLFPRVQFIMSNHSPMLLMGLKQKFGEAFRVLDMPEGVFIGVERYSEFIQSFLYYSQTKRYEEELNDWLFKSNKPIILTEGETDPIYIEAALRLRGLDHVLAKIEIRSVGYKEGKNAIGTGMAELDAVFKTLKQNEKLSNRLVMLLYDCDAPNNIVNGDLDNIIVRRISCNTGNEVVIKGVENLLDPALIGPDFYSVKTKKLDDGGENTNKSLQKTKLCNYICHDRRNVDDFSGFDEVIGFVMELAQRV
jgi:predicted ATPase